MRPIPLAVIGGFWLFVAACASLSPEQEARRALFWEAAKECEQKVEGIRIHSVDEDGTPHGLSYLDETHTFIACYQDRVRQMIAALQKVGSGRLALPPGSPTTTSAPIQMVGGITLVQAAINESRMATLVLDTGASTTIITPAIADQLNISVPKDAPRKMLVGLGGKLVSVPFVRVESVKVGIFAVEDLDVGVYDAFPGIHRLDGLLGADFLSHFSMTVDPGSQVLTLEPKPPAASSQEPRVDKPEGKEVVPSPQSVTTGGPSPLDWKPGYEWSFRWESPRGKGTLVWVVTAETEVNGLASYVVKSGSRETAFAKGENKLGWHMDKVDGVVVERASPPNFYFAWPLEVGKTWQHIYTWEGIQARQTEERTRRCRVEARERIAVPAGTFQTFRVACTNQLGQPTHTYWFSEAVKMFVKDRSYYSYGVRDRELTSYKLD